MNKSKINLGLVKQTLDNATWNYEFCSHSGQDIEKACSYLDSQRFSKSKIQKFIPDIKDTDIEEDWNEQEVSKYIAYFIADCLAWDRISRFTYQRYIKPNGWGVNESVVFNIW